MTKYQLLESLRINLAQLDQLLSVAINSEQFAGESLQKLVSGKRMAAALLEIIAKEREPPTMEVWDDD